MARSVWHTPLKLHSIGYSCRAQVLMLGVRGEIPRTCFPLPQVIPEGFVRVGAAVDLAEPLPACACTDSLSDL